MISSGWSLAIAARTTCSTSLASRTLRVSTPCVSGFSYSHTAVAVFVAAIRIPDHPSKGVADRYKGELDEQQCGHPRTGCIARSSGEAIRFPLEIQDHRPHPYF